MKTLADILVNAGTNTDNGITFITDTADDVSISYSELYTNAQKILFYLQNSYKLKPKDLLIIQTENNYDFINIFWACILGNIIPVPITYVNSHIVCEKLMSVWELTESPRIIMPNKHLSTILSFSNSYNKREELTACAINSDIIHEAIRGEQQGELQKASADDIAFIQFSSGSTGNPKGVKLTHQNLITNITDIKNVTEATADDSSLSWMPLTHDMGIIGFHLTPIISMCKQFLMSTFVFAFYPMNWLQKVHEYDITITSCPNFGYEHFMNCFVEDHFKGVDLSKLRTILNGAEPISYDICKRFEKLLEPYGLRNTVIRPAYGLAEASLIVSVAPFNEELIPHKLKRDLLNPGDTVSYQVEADNATLLVDVGPKVENIDVRISDDNGNVLPDLTIGNLCIKGDSVTSGYYNNSEATKQIIEEEGWLNTGDLAYRKNGRYIIIGRKKEVIFVNGTNYYSSDLERAAQEVEGIDMNKIAICGIPNEKSKSDEIIAFILYKKRKMDAFHNVAAALKAHMLNKTGINLKHIIPVKNIPTTTSGKIQRFVLASDFLSGHYNSIIEQLSTKQTSKSAKEKPTTEIAGGKSSEIEQTIIDTWNEITKNNLKISKTENFFDVGGDSLLLAKVANQLEKKYPGKVNVSDFFGYPTIAKLAEFISDQLATNKKHVMKGINLSEELISNDMFGESFTKIRIDNKLANYRLFQETQLASLAFVLSKNVGNDIVLYAGNGKADTLIECTFDFNKINTLEELQVQIQQIGSSQKAEIDIKSINRSRSAKNNIRVVLSDRNAITEIDALQSISDITISYSPSQPLVHCTYKNKIAKSLATNIFHQYAFMYDNFQNQLLEVESSVS